MKPIENVLKIELDNWANNKEILKLIQEYYIYSGTVLVVRFKGSKLMMSCSWQYTLANVMNNDCPGSKIGDIITEFIGKVDKDNPEGLKFLLEEF